jgi:hypothetical protein
MANKYGGLQDIKIRLNIEKDWSMKIGCPPHVPPDIRVYADIKLGPKRFACTQRLSGADRRRAVAIAAEMLREFLHALDARGLLNGTILALKEDEEE